MKNKLILICADSLCPQYEKFDFGSVGLGGKWPGGV